MQISSTKTVFTVIELTKTFLQFHYINVMKYYQRCFKAILLIAVVTNHKLRGTILFLSFYSYIVTITFSNTLEQIQITNSKWNKTSRRATARDRLKFCRPPNNSRYIHITVLYLHAYKRSNNSFVHLYKQRYAIFTFKSSTCNELITPISP